MRLFPTPGLVALALLLPVATEARAGPLPLKPGTYVQADTACQDPPFAVMRSYDGQGLGGPHAADCRTRVLSRQGGLYRLSTTCNANGDGSPATPSTVRETLRVPSRTVMVSVPTRAGEAPTRFRWCGAG